MEEERLRPVRQAVLGAVDQAVSSLTNFAVVVIAAHLLSAGEFGVFAFSYTVYSIIISGQQALIGQVLVLEYGTSELLRTRIREALFLSLGVSIFVSLVILSWGLFASDNLGPSLVVLALCIPGLFLQDACRFGCSVLNRMSLAVWSDVMWAAFAVVFLAIGVRFYGSGVVVLMSAWTIAGAVAGVMFAIHFAAGGRPSVERFMRSDYLGYRFVLEFVIARAPSQALVLVLGLIAGLEATGGVRGATVLFGPLAVVLNAASSFGAPVLRSVLPNRRTPALVVMGIILSSVAVTLSLVLLYIPSSVGERMLGDSWSQSREVLFPIGVQMVFLSLATVIFLALRLVSPESTLRLRIIAAGVIVPSFCVGYIVGGVVGAVWGLTMYSIVLSIAGVLEYSRLARLGVGVSVLESH